MLPADSRHKILRKQIDAALNRFVMVPDLNLFVQVQKSPSPASIGSPGRTAQGCANISQVTSLLQCVSYLEVSVK